MPPQWRGSFKAARMAAPWCPCRAEVATRNGGAALKLPESNRFINGNRGAFTPAMEGQL